ncbi:hypothetical protein PV797_11815 [Clostridiaceae bacterium M8S5]|nr:hypothetical protein PV797_11815 [Clostridiaceae bacterium M8S5]
MNIFGDIRYDEFWRRDYELTIFGSTFTGELLILAKEEEEIEEMQKLSFKEFEQNKDVIIAECEEQLYLYYCSVVDEYKDCYRKKDFDSHSSKVSNKKVMKNLLKFKAVYVPYSFVKEQRRIGILFESTFEKEHGIGVEIIDNKITEIGYQVVAL